MDSLLSTYASSDDDDGHVDQSPTKTISSSSASFFTSLPPGKSSSWSASTLFTSIPPPKSQPHQNPSNTKSQLQPPSVTIGSVPGSTSLFNSLPQPRSRQLETLEFQTTLPPPEFGDSNPKVILNLPTLKKVVQFKSPCTTFAGGDWNSEDDEDDEEENERKKRREIQASTEARTVKSFLSGIPAPKNTKAALGALPASGSGRRSIIDADIPSLKQQKVEEEASVAVDDTTLVVDNYHQGGYVDGYGPSAAGVDSSSLYPSGEGYGDYGGVSYGGEYESYGGYGQYESNWIDRSGSDSMVQASDVPDIMSREMGKRRKTDIATEIIEVKQDELMKNRPREDQVKATGIAFGPSYQPVSSAKGKPSKLHKRKHQIGSLYFDMKQKEMELAERRSRGYLTKAETHAKYGW